MADVCNRPEIDTYRKDEIEGKYKRPQAVDAPRGTALRGLIALPMRFFWQGPSRSLLAVAVAVGASSVWVSGALIYDPPGALAD